MADWLYRSSLRVVPLLYVGITSLLFATCRVTVHGEEHRRFCQKHRAYICSLWHYGILYILHHFRDESGTVMVSASRDGEYIARVAAYMGFSTIRGSRTSQGVRALIQLLGQLKKGQSVGIVADGSQGPPRRLQAGVLLLAGRSGAPILPFAWAASRYITFSSWDRTVLPLPFSHLTVCYGEPFLVPEKLQEGELEHYRLQLEERMNSLYEEAWSKYGKKNHETS